MGQAAQRVVLSHPAALSTWGRDVIDGRPFRTYLRTVHDEVTVGDQWEEFVGVGCCGDTLDVSLRVEVVEGGDELTDSTTIEFTGREACDIDGGWTVQSASGP